MYTPLPNSSVTLHNASHSVSNSEMDTALKKKETHETLECDLGGFTPVPNSENDKK